VGLLALLLACGDPLAPALLQEVAVGDDGAADGRSPAWRLAEEDSPYLRSHADNPVEWYPWGQEAFERARQLDRPVFLSIGYSSCHWCHVMEHETFEDEACARLLNEHFVAIKVDREQRPDVDRQYMRALQIMTGGGGWPASLFLTPEGEPFYGGTYFPPEPARGLPGFREILTAVHEAWTGDRQALLDGSRQLAEYLEGDELPEAGEWDAVALLDAATTELTGRLDPKLGGTFGAPKFPPTMLLRFLMRQQLRSGVTVTELVETTLDAMAQGGLHDHLSGGFHRYSTDARWRVPHFEKMLYDNALLALTYAEAAAWTGAPRHADVARSTLQWMVAEMRSPEGLYVSAFDADSLPFDGRGQPLPDMRPEEGLYYTWTLDELLAVLGETDGLAFASLHGASAEGNFEGRNILAPFASRAELAEVELAGLSSRGAVRMEWLDRCRARLLEARAARPPPFRDDKCLAAWNGLALSAFARAGTLLGDAELVDEARRLASALDRLIEERDGGPFLSHQWFEGRASGEGDLLDHAALAIGLLDAYEATGEVARLERSLSLARVLLDTFEDGEDGGFFDTRGGDPLLPGRGRDVYDGAVPAGSSLAVELLVRLAPLDDSGRFDRAAERALARLAPLVERVAPAFPGLLLAMDAWHGPLAEIVLDGRGAEHAALLDAARGRLLPSALLVVHAAEAGERLSPLLGGPPSLLAERRAPAGEARAWVCRRGVCLAPTADVGTLVEQLGELTPRP
jgi:uncharacterized protein YyaL (SSP411 family)